MWRPGRLPPVQGPLQEVVGAGEMNPHACRHGVAMLTRGPCEGLAAHWFVAVLSGGSRPNLRGYGRVEWCPRAAQGRHTHAGPLYAYDCARATETVGKIIGFESVAQTVTLAASLAWLQGARARPFTLLRGQCTAPCWGTMPRRVVELAYLGIGCAFDSFLAPRVVVTRYGISPVDTQCLR